MKDGSINIGGYPGFFFCALSKKSAMHLSQKSRNFSDSVFLVQKRFGRPPKKRKKISGFGSIADRSMYKIKKKPVDIIRWVLPVPSNPRLSVQDYVFVRKTESCLHFAFFERLIHTEIASSVPNLEGEDHISMVRCADVRSRRANFKE